MKKFAYPYIERQQALPVTFENIGWSTPTHWAPGNRWCQLTFKVMLSRDQITLDL